MPGSKRENRGRRRLISDETVLVEKAYVLVLFGGVLILSQWLPIICSVSNQTLPLPFFGER
jgi:hypothetical protein